MTTTVTGRIWRYWKCLVLSTIFCSGVLLDPATGFVVHPILKRPLSASSTSSSTKPKHLRHPLHVAVDPMHDKKHQVWSRPRYSSAATDNSPHRPNNKPFSKNKSHTYNKSNNRRRDRGPSGLRSAEQIEQRFLSSLEALRVALLKNDSSLVNATLHFPTVRECNEALAAFGDASDLLRALKLYGKMRKLKLYQSKLQQRTGRKWILPVPSLVTYSTLMSRAVKQQKPLVAIRLWDLMDSPEIVPDVKAANILLNAYAKLADVSSAKKLLLEMKEGFGETLKTQPMTPNQVTMNTLLNACQEAGDLDAALECKQEMQNLGIRADTRTYTTLIATVARAHSQNAGKNDPSMAFTFLQEMQDLGIQPNGMTYSALIDACGRCRRSDLALQGLRMMIRQKKQESKYLQKSSRNYDSDKYVLPNEVGAWTAAIDACGKSDRLETATKLFYSMSNFGCEPNTITCGCLTDSLLRAGRTAETLGVLRYMKGQGLEPSEVMYTSLMSRAEHLVARENSWSTKTATSSFSSGGVDISLSFGGSPMETEEESTCGTKAIEIYTELMQALVDTKSTLKPESGTGGRNDSPHRDSSQISREKQDHRTTLLVKVFLVFQQMKQNGAKPDLACYNALLRACARAGEWDHCQRIMHELQDLEHLEPNDKSWRELLRTASKLQRSDLALQAWRQGLAYRRSRRTGSINNLNNRWIPSVSSFSEFITTFSKEAHKPGQDMERKTKLLYAIVQFYQIILRGDKSQIDNEKYMGMSLLDGPDLHSNRRAMLLILQATVTLRDLYGATAQGMVMQKLSTRIVELESFHDIRSRRLTWHSYQALEKAQSWLQQEKRQGAFYE